MKQEYYIYYNNIIYSKAKYIHYLLIIYIIKSISYLFIFINK